MRPSPARLLAFITLLCPAPASAQISPAEYAARRAALLAPIDSGVVIAFGEVAPITDWPGFYQLPSFYYLTGFTEPDAVLLLLKRSGAVSETMLVPERNLFSERYTGRRSGPEDLAARTGMAGRRMAELRPTVDSLGTAGLPFFVVRDYRSGGYIAEDSLTRGARFLEGVRRDHPWLVLTPIDDRVDRLRATKSPAELALIRRAVEISNRGHLEAMKVVAPGCGENEIQAIMEGIFRRLGGDRPPYTSIVGSGPNALILHYWENNRVMRDGELVLIDAATSVEHYTADVTRTLPVNGRFTPAQRQTYQLVLDGLKAYERQIRPGVPSSVATDSARGAVVQGLLALGLIQSDTATFDGFDWMRCPAAGCPQRALYAWRGYAGHGMGLEGVDWAHYYGGAPFQVGEVLTVEPGLYFSADFWSSLPDTPRNRAMKQAIGPVFERYKGIGIKIEDDYALTGTGLERMTEALPREVEEVERMMRGRGEVACGNK
jgi:Xaa-Pro aminopeptidase